MSESILSSNWGIGLLVLIEVLLVAGVVALGARTALLRDSGKEDPDFAKRTFSLAKSQLAFWTIVVIGSFIYLYFSAGKFSGVLNNTALILLGISTATAALSSATKPNAAAPAAPSAAPRQGHRGFLDDILSDCDGMNVHRLQMLIWTIVFGGIFIHETAKAGAFPEFDTQAYVLMGISIYSSLKLAWGTSSRL